MLKSKTANSVNSQVPQDNKQSSPSAFFARLYWMVIGDMALVFTAISIFTKRSGFGTADIVYWAILVSIICVRYLDIKRLDGLTASGEPANTGHWRRYAVLMIVSFAVIWIAAHLPALLGK